LRQLVFSAQLFQYSLHIHGHMTKYMQLGKEVKQVWSNY
jgi:formylmethanofuran dehydrogenase subunit E